MTLPDMTLRLPTRRGGLSISTITRPRGSIREWSRRCCRIFRPSTATRPAPATAYGWEAKEAVDIGANRSPGRSAAARARSSLPAARPRATTWRFAALAERKSRRGSHLITVRTEHRAVLDPIERLGRRGCEVTLLDVEQVGSDRAGWLDPQRVHDALRDDTLLVSVMLANNEIGVIQPLAEIARICRERGVLVHCDATQAVGKLPVDVAALGLDLMSFSAHKIYGPKGVGALWVRRTSPQVRLEAQIAGGGHEGGLRSGTLNVPGIVGFARALELCLEELPSEAERLAGLRQRLFAGLSSQLEGVALNGPSLTEQGLRLPANLNVSFAYVDGEALVMNMRDIAVSSGSACTSANPEPSHVLRALGLDDDTTRSSLRFGLGRFNTTADIELAISTVVDVVGQLRKLGSRA